MVKVRVLACMLTVCLAASFATAAANGQASAAAADAIVQMTLNSKKAQVNGEEYTLDVAPVKIGARTMVPLRFIGNVLEAKLDWYAPERRITLSLNGGTIVLWVDKTEALVDGNKVTMDVPATIMNNTTLVPVRFVSEKLHQLVDFNDANRTNHRYHRKRRYG